MSDVKTYIGGVYFGNGIIDSNLKTSSSGSLKSIPYPFGKVIVDYDHIKIGGMGKWEESKLDDIKVSTTKLGRIKFILPNKKVIIFDSVTNQKLLRQLTDEHIALDKNAIAHINYGNILRIVLLTMALIIIAIFLYMLLDKK